MPPPAAAEVSVAQLTVLAELDEELDDELDEELDEHPVASSTAAATPANANRYGDLTKCLLKSFPVRSGTRLPRSPGGGAEEVTCPLAPKLRMQINAAKTFSMRHANTG
jgi:hypothetical protein